MFVPPADARFGVISDMDDTVIRTDARSLWRMIRLTLFAVVLRLGLTLWWLSRQRADLEELAASDPLTGLGNYRAFQERLSRVVAAAAERDEPVSAVVLDLDHFKALNDTFGHAEGDAAHEEHRSVLHRPEDA